MYVSECRLKACVCVCGSVHQPVSQVAFIHPVEWRQPSLWGGGSRRRATNQLIIQVAGVSRATLLYIHAWQTDTLSPLFLSLALCFFPTSFSYLFALSLILFLLSFPLWPFPVSPLILSCPSLSECLFLTISFSLPPLLKTPHLAFSLSPLASFP